MEILKLREHSELASEAAEWFHSKWDIPVEEYAGSIQECLTGKSIVPQWYVAVENQQIIGGIGVIENDFHNRKDLTPNVCAVYVEENYRCQGIAGKLVDYFVDLARKRGKKGVVLTCKAHLIGFYENHGFQCFGEADSSHGGAKWYDMRNIF